MGLVIKNINSTIWLMEKLITQKHEFGCGVASAAFVMGKSYEQAIRFFDTKKINTLGFYCKDLVKALKDSGLNYEYKYLKPKLKNKIYQEGVIIFIKRSKDYPAGHYLARGEGYWMDPWINFKSDKDIKNARAGLRKRLPGTPIYALFLKII